MAGSQNNEVCQVKYAIYDTLFNVGVLYLAKGDRDFLSADEPFSNDNSLSPSL